MRKLLSTILIVFAFAVAIQAQVYSNVLVEVNTVAQLSSLNVSAPFVWCRENNTLYYYDPVALTFTPYPSGTAAVTSVNTRTGAVVLTKSDVALTNVDNTSDANKPVSTAQQTALDAKLYKAANLADLTDATEARLNIGLPNVDNTSDANKPISTATQTALNGKVATTAPYGYAINVQALTSSPVDATTIFFGDIPRAPTTTAGTSQIFIRKAGTIKAAQIYCFSGTAGTNEAWSISIRLNNTTDTLIQTVSAATSARTFTNSGLNIAVAAGDYIEIKSVNPTWATNPLTTVFGGYIYIE